MVSASKAFELVNLWGQGLPWVGLISVAGWFISALSVGDRPAGLLSVSLAWFAGVSFILCGLMCKACARTWFFSRRNSLWGGNPPVIADTLLDRVLNIRYNWEQHTLRSFLETCSWLHVLLRVHSVAAVHLGPLASIVAAVAAGTVMGAACVLLGEHWTSTFQEAEGNLLGIFGLAPLCVTGASHISEGIRMSPATVASNKKTLGTSSVAAQGVAIFVALVLSGTLVHLRDTNDFGLTLILTALGNVAFITCGELFIKWRPTRWVGIQLQDRWTNAARNWEKRPIRSGLETSFYLGAMTHSYVLVDDVLAAALLGTLCGIVITLTSEWMLSFAPPAFAVTDAGASDSEEDANCDDDASFEESTRTFTRVAFAWVGGAVLFATNRMTESPVLALFITVSSGVVLLWLAPYVCGELLDPSHTTASSWYRWSAVQLGRRLVLPTTPSGWVRYIRTHSVPFHVASFLELCGWLLLVMWLHGAISSWVMASQLGTILSAGAILTGEYLDWRPVPTIHAKLFPINRRPSVTVADALRYVAKLGTDRHETFATSKRRLGCKYMHSSIPLISWSEVIRMNGREEGGDDGSRRPSWIVIEDFVYDVTDWTGSHPGGSSVISKFAGADATDQFAAFHRPETSRLLREFLVGRLQVDEKQPSSLARKPMRPAPLSSTKEYRAVRRYMWDHGYFDTAETDHDTFLYFAKKHLVVIAFALASLFTAAVLIPTQNEAKSSLPMLCWLSFKRLGLAAFGGVALGMAWQQLGFLAHDSLHRGVSRSKKQSKTYENSLLVPWRAKHRLLGWIHASVLFGISGAMWLEEHSVHHAITMRPMEDPQFNYLPIWLISRKEIWWKRYKLGWLDRLLISVQHYTFVPLAMLIGRCNLYIISVLYALKHGEIIDLIGMFTFWLWFTSVVALLPSSDSVAEENEALVAAAQAACMPQNCSVLPWMVRNLIAPVLTALSARLVFVLASHWTAGFLHVQFLVNHLATDTFTTEEERKIQFFAFQIRTTRNISASRETEWLHGGLHDQYEHHLFPQLPRHRLSEVRTVVRELCSRHSLKYETVPFTEALRACLKEFKNLALEVASGHLD